MNLGLLHLAQGYGQALEALTTSRSLCQELGLEQKRAAVDVDLTRAYRALRLDAEAAESCGHAIESFHKLDLPFELATALLLLRGQIAEQRGDANAARRDLGERHRRCTNESAMSPGRPSRRWLACASRWATLGATPCRRCWRSRRLCGAAAVLGAPQHATDAYLLVADIQVALGHDADARATLRTALDLATKLGADGVLYQAHLAEGLILEANAPDEAGFLRTGRGTPAERLRARARADDLKLAVVGQERACTGASRGCCSGGGRHLLRSMCAAAAAGRQHAGPRRVPLARTRQVARVAGGRPG